MVIPSHEFLDTFLRAVGVELRRARLDHQWSRARLVTALDGAVTTTNEIVAYEAARRTMRLTRLVELCHALQLDPSHVVRTAHHVALAEQSRRLP